MLATEFAASIIQAMNGRRNQNAYKHGYYTKQAIQDRKILRQLIRHAESLIEEIDS